MSRFRHLMAGLALASTTFPCMAASAGPWSDPCAPAGASAPLLSLAEDGLGGVLISLQFGPPSGTGFLLARVQDSPPVPAPRSGLPGCAGIASGMVVQTIPLDGNGRALVGLSGSVLAARPIVSMVTLPLGGTLADTALSNSVPVLAETGVVSYQSGELIVTEIMKDPSAVSDTKGEWIEIHNPGDQPVDLEGWTLTDLGSEMHVIFNDWNGLEVPPGGELVLARNGDPTENGGVAVDYVTSGFTLGNTDDEVILLSPSSVRADTVIYSDANQWPDVSGSSMCLGVDYYDVFLGDDPIYWCAGQQEWAPGTDFGSPGVVNDSCP